MSDKASPPEKANLFQILINDEEQYSLWPADKTIPLGWKHVFGPTDKEACLNYVKEVWTDMRPKSLREIMDQNKKENR